MYGIIGIRSSPPSSPHRTLHCGAVPRWPLRVVAVQKIQRVANLWWTTDLMPSAAMLDASQGGFLAASSCLALASPFAASLSLLACIYAVGLALSLLAIIFPQCGRLHTLAARRSYGRSWRQFCVAVLIASAPIATQAAESVIDIHNTPSPLGAFSLHLPCTLLLSHKLI